MVDYKSDHITADQALTQALGPEGEGRLVLFTGLGQTIAV